MLTRMMQKTEMQKTLVSIVFSFRNEEEVIPELVDRIAAALDPLKFVSYELIFVNDDSTDASFSILCQLQRQFPITIVNMSRRFGVSPCVLAGFAEAKGDAVIYLDADLQDPPELLPEMIARFLDGADVVHTTRTSRDGESAVKMWLTRKAYRVINFFSDLPMPENAGDFKLLSRRVVNHILDLKEFDPYMRGLSIWVGYRQDFLPYRRQARGGGVTKWPLLSRGPLREFIRGLAAFSAAPLYISFLLGLVTSLLAICLVFYAIVTKFFGVAVPGTSGVLIAVAFFNGIVLMTNGIIGIYVARIYNQVVGRPNYIVKNVIRHSRPTPDAN